MISIQSKIAGLSLVIGMSVADARERVQGDGLVINATPFEFVITDSADAKSFPNVKAGQQVSYTIPTDQGQNFVVTYVNKSYPSQSCVFSFKTTSVMGDFWTITANSLDQRSGLTCTVDANKNLVISR